MSVFSTLTRWRHRMWTEPPKESWRKTQVRLGLKEFTEFDQHVWCLSTGRVGTKTISELMKLVPTINSVHEPEPKLFGLGKSAFQFKDGFTKDSLIEAVSTCRGGLVGLSQLTYVESSPQVTFLARQLAEVFPNSKFIHIIRHPIDIVESGMKRRWYSGNPTDKWRIEPDSSSPFYENWSDWGAFEKNIWSWAATNTWINDFFQELPGHLTLQIKSENLFRGDEQTINGLFNFCGGKIENKREVERVIDKKLNANVGKSSDKSYSWNEQQLKTLNEIAGDAMQKFAYKV